MTRIPVVTADDVFESQSHSLELAWVAGREGGDRCMEAPNARFPGMALVGHLNFIHPNRVQVVGPAELEFLDGSPQRDALIGELFTGHPSVMVVVSDGLAVPEDMIAAADAHRVALLSSRQPSPGLIHALQFYLARALAEFETMHGVFMDVMGAGVLLVGKSGIGKSEVALELLSRNHRLVADDAVEVLRVSPDVLHGRCPEALVSFLEVRGLGILNVRAMFGESAVLQERRLDLIVRFERMTRERVEGLDRLHVETQKRRILGVEVPEVVLLVAPGRNLAVLVEAAARNHQLHSRGVQPLAEFIDRQERLMGRRPADKENG